MTSLQGKIVLDVGCGFGAYGLAAEECGASRAVGIDVNREYIKRSILELSILADAQYLPLRDSCIDIVLMVEVLEHLPREMEAVREVGRVLKKRGLFLLTVPNRFYPFEIHGMKIGYAEIPNMFGIGIPFLSWMPNLVRKRVEMAKIYSQKKIIQTLRKASFEPLKVEYMMPPLDKLKYRTLANCLRRLERKLEGTWLKYLACHIIIVSTVIK